MAALWIAALWVAFGATHMWLASTGTRPRLVKALGEQGYLGVYSLIALATFVPLVGIYFGHQHAGPHLWYWGQVPGVRWLAYLGMGTALVLAVGGLIQPSAASMAGGSTRVRGAARITRHPLFMGFGLFGIAHLLTANVNAAELAFFGGFPVFAWVGSRHQDARKLAAGVPGYAEWCAGTPFVPFTGGGTLQGLREMALPGAVGIALAVLVRTFHTAWFGGAP